MGVGVGTAITTTNKATNNTKQQTTANKKECDRCRTPNGIHYFILFVLPSLIVIYPQPLSVENTEQSELLSLKPAVRQTVNVSPDSEWQT